MQEDTGIFIITPPDMHLVENGPSITVISTDEEFIQQVENAHEAFFSSVSMNIYHPNGHVKDSNLAWTLSVMNLSDTVFVDLETANELGIITSMVSKKTVVFVGDKSRKELTKLFNTSGDYPVYKSMEEYMDFIL